MRSTSFAVTQKERVCAYARVSTREKEQLGSLENQLHYFDREFGTPNSRYLLVHLYADCGRSGTSLQRPDFDQMVRDAGIDKNQLDGDLFRIVQPPQFQRILVKNTSRFARNVSCDMLLKTLRKNGVYVDFVDTGLSTERPGDILTLQIFQVLDEHESRDKSRKVLFGLDESIEQGNIQSNRRLYGYTYYPQPVNRLIRNPQEAAVVRLIFQLYTQQGMGAYRIAHELMARSLYPRSGKPWNPNTILGMLQNETYTGKGVRRKWSNGLIFERHSTCLTGTPIVFATDRVEPIISEEVFAAAQAILHERAAQALHVSDSGTRAPFTGKVFCGACGSSYLVGGSRTSQKAHGSTRVYMCRSKHQTAATSCTCKNVTEAELDALLRSRTFQRKAAALLCSAREALLQQQRMLQNAHGAGSPPGAALARQLKETDLLLRRFDDQLAALRHNALSQADRLALISRITVFPSRALRMKLLTVAELLQGEQAP